jgi:hypothetical protein
LRKDEFVTNVLNNFHRLETKEWNICLKFKLIANDI